MLVVELNNKNLLTKQNIDGFLLGVKDLSSDTYLKLENEEVKEIINIIHQNHQLAFIDLTGMYHDIDLTKLKDTITFLSDADYFVYHDMIITSLVSKNKRFYYGLTYGTNQYDLAISQEENKYSLISPELSLEEIKNINLEDLFVICFGTWEIFHSRRELIMNYFKYRGWKKEDAEFEIVEEFRPNEFYPIIEENGTKIYLNGIYNISTELKEIKHNLLIKSFNLDLDIMNQVIDLYSNALSTLDFETLDKGLKELNLPLNKGLLYQKSILTKGEQNNE